MKWIDNHIEVDAPKRPKKCTATRFASVLGANPWTSPFAAWCAITRTYEEPFVDNQYTIAGKCAEPKIIDWLRSEYVYVMEELKTPTDLYGADYFKYMRGDFFHENPIFGGMWDVLLREDGKPSTVIEIKTSSRPEDWFPKGTIPENYALQSALYAYLLGVDDVIMVASFLEPSDYDAPENFKPSSENTITVEFKVSERYPDFSAKIAQATDWWHSHVVTGISPDYDEKKDAETLKALRTNNLTPDTDIDALVKEAEKIKSEIDWLMDKVTKDLGGREKRLEDINKIIKEHAIGQFRDGDKKVEIRGNAYTWTISKAESSTVDKDALDADGLLEKYSKKSTTYRIAVK